MPAVATLWVWSASSPQPSRKPSEERSSFWPSFSAFGNSGIVGAMKSGTALSLVLIALVISSFALAQNQASQEKSHPQSLTQTAATVASNAKHQDLNGYLAIYVSPENWASGLKDGDLGPFLKQKEAKPGRSVVFLFSQSKDAAICVYFDGATAFGMTAVKAGAGGKI